MQARFYDPTTGRLMGVDPETEGQDEFSPYHHSFNNPIRFSDPNGRFASDDPWYKKIYNEAKNFVKNTEFEVITSMSIGLQANFKAVNIAEVEVNAYSVKVAESGFSVQGGNVDSYSQVMNAKQSGNGPDNYNAPVEEKAAVGAKIFGVGVSGEVTVDSDRYGNRSNEKITVKQTASEGSFSTSKVTEFQGGKTTEKIENSYTIGGALLIGVELKIDMSKRIKDNQK